MITRNQSLSWLNPGMAGRTGARQAFHDSAHTIVGVNIRPVIEIALELSDKIPASDHRDPVDPSTVVHHRPFSLFGYAERPIKHIGCDHVVDGMI
jgi:hypothetical protein